MRVLKMTGLALLVSASGFAQDLVAQKQAMAAQKQSMEVAPDPMVRVAFEKAMTGAPYSAETSTEGLQVLSDGNRIVRKTTGRVYRDGEGRTRREEDGPNGGMAISIVDPVAGYSYSLDPESKVAWRTPTGTAAGIMNKLELAEQKQRVEADQVLAAKLEAERLAQRAGGGGEIRPRTAGGGASAGDAVVLRAPGGAMTAFTASTGPLERKTIDGIPVLGRKTTTTIPAGKVGNEQPLTIVSEEWRSPELGVLVMTHYSDPRTGDSSYRLTNIVRAEPDQSLFLVPPDYTVKDSGVRKLLEAKK